MLICRICHNQDGNKEFIAREMMFGTREEFSYFECVVCGCLQIQTVPDDLSPYYPDEYYSLEERPAMSPIRIFLKRRLMSYYMHGRDPIGKILSRKYDSPFNPDWLKRTGVNKQSAILDLGCGTGVLLLHLQLAGFRQLTGADPFIAQDIVYPGGLIIHKQQASQLEGSFDLIMMHHALEHMDNQVEVLREVERLLKPGGFAVIRIPMAGSHAWRTYGTDWVQLDAPRHLYLHTKDSLRRVAQAAGLRVDQTIFESNAFQFWGSEQYRQGISLRNERSYFENPERSPFSPEQIASWDKQAEALNAKQDGDTATFYLKKQ